MRSRLLLLTMALFAGAGSCSAPNEQSFVILRASPLSQDNGTYACTVNESVFVSSGILDLALIGIGAGSYIACPIVQNNLVSTIDMNRGVESSQIVLKSIEVDIAFPPDLGVTFMEGETRFKRDIYNVLAPSDRVAVPIDLIPAVTADRLAAAGITNTVADVKFRFQGSHNGSDITSNDMPFRVQICRGCLVQSIGPCCGAATNAGSPNPAQDKRIDCCDSPGGLVCPARAIAGSACPP